MKFSHNIERYPCHCGNVALTVFHTQNIHHHMWKTVRTTLQCIVGLQWRGEGHEMEKNCGKICLKVFLAIQTFSPGLENNETSKCGFECFPCIGTYILCVENCQSYISTHSCLPIPGRLFYNVRQFYEPRIWGFLGFLGFLSVSQLVFMSQPNLVFVSDLFIVTKFLFFSSNLWDTENVSQEIQSKCLSTF